MGGIVGADTIISILNDPPVGHSRHLPFPHIIGMLAFDTPYLGLSPSMFAHGAETKYKTASTAYTTISSVASGLFATQAGAAAQATTVAKTSPNHSRPGSADRNDSPTTLWGKWGKVAALSGAAAALAGGAAAAYVKRDDLASGFTWVSSHLEFVGALMKGEELKNRVETVSTHPDIGFANLFTSLGERFGSATFFDGKERTFCSVPEPYSAVRKKFYRCINAQAKDEVDAHVSLFTAKTNPGYYEMTDRAKSLITVWVPAEAWPPVEEDSEEEYRRRKAQRKREKKERKHDEEYYAAKAERRASRHESESSSRKSSKHGYYVEDAPPAAPVRRESKHDSHANDSEIWEKEARREERRSSKSSSRHETPTREVERGYGAPMRTQSFEGEMEKERRSSKSSRHAPSRTQSFEPEGLVRRESAPVEKVRRGERGSRSPKVVDLDHNPWR